MKKMILAAAFAVTGCASNESAIKSTLKKNPQIVFDVIEENPEQFMASVQKASQNAQQAQYQKKLEEMKQAQEKDLGSPRQPKLSEDRRMIGDSKGKIVLVEYGDFQCPACKMGQSALHEFKERHKGQVQFYFKNMPLSFHEQAMPAALYFEALALQDKSKARKFYHFVFDNQRSMSGKDFLRNAAKQTGADMARLEKDIKSEKVIARVKEDMDEFERFGFTGTPVVILNGVALHGAQRVEELERVLKLTQY